MEIGVGNNATINQHGNTNYGTAEQVFQIGGQIDINQNGNNNYAYGDQRNGEGGTLTIDQGAAMATAPKSGRTPSLSATPPSIRTEIPTKP